MAVSTSKPWIPPQNLTRNTSSLLQNKPTPFRIQCFYGDRRAGSRRFLQPQKPQQSLRRDFSVNHGINGLNGRLEHDSGGGEGGENEKFVEWFRQAWPYICGHRGSTFVVIISGEMVASPHLDGILQASFFLSCSYGLRLFIVVI